MNAIQLRVCMGSTMSAKEGTTYLSGENFAQCLTTCLYLHLLMNVSCACMEVCHPSLTFCLRSTPSNDLRMYQTQASCAICYGQILTKSTAGVITREESPSSSERTSLPSFVRNMK